jgi:hypothetical protein
MDIQNDKPWKQYVLRQRVQEVRQLTSKQRWNIAQVAKIPLIYLPVASNDLIDNRLGREGPAFLKKPECEWANSTQTKLMIQVLSNWRKLL